MRPPERTACAIYISVDFDERQELMDRLGKHKTGKSCLYVNRLEEVDAEALGELIDISLRNIRQQYPENRN